MESRELLSILKHETRRTMGCTDPGTITLAAARACRALGMMPESVHVLASPHLYKNAAAVGVPGTGQRGISIAAAAGAVLDRYEDGLAILDNLDEDSLTLAGQMVEEGRVKVGWREMDEILYVRVDLTAGEHSAYAVIQGDYDHVVEVGHNGEVVEGAERIKREEGMDPIAAIGIDELLPAVEALPQEDLSFLRTYAETNCESARRALLDDELPFTGAAREKGFSRSEVERTAASVQRWTGTAAEARMAGKTLPIMAVAGSGNQGITSLLGVLSAAEELGSSPEATDRALAYSAAVTVFIKSRMTRLSTLCGAVTAAAPGVAAGVVHLIGGSHSDMVHAMQTVIGTLGGIVCDGAKESCAYKLSLAASFAVQAAYYAVGGAYIRGGAGIISESFDQSVRNLGRLNGLLDEVNLEMIRMISSG